MRIKIKLQNVLDDAVNDSLTDEEKGGTLKEDEIEEGRSSCEQQLGINSIRTAKDATRKHKKPKEFKPNSETKRNCLEKWYDQEL